MISPPLTDQAIRAFQSPTKGYKIHWDGTLRGFGCRVSQAGTKAFVVLVASGRPATIGRYPTLSLADARREARKLLAEKTLGRVKPTHTAFEDAKRDYLAQCAAKNRPSTLHSYKRHLEAHYRFDRRSMTDITPREIIRRLNAIAGPSERHHATVVGKLFFRWAVRQHIIDKSPMEDVQAPSNGKGRERVLSDAELRCIWKATECPRTHFHAIVRLLILTGQRRGEIAALQWEWINEVNQTITFPAIITKNKRQHVIPYCTAVATVLTSIPRISPVYLFPASRERKLGLREAADELEAYLDRMEGTREPSQPQQREHSRPNGTQAQTEDNRRAALLRVADTLDYAHEAVAALGLNPDEAKALMIGWKQRGMHAKSLVFPLFDEGELVGYGSFKDGKLTLPKNLSTQ